jgi:RHS repeat-associated protein
VSSASAKLDGGGTLTGTAVIENAGTAHTRATTAGVAWKSSATHGSVQLGRFAVPALKPGQRHKTTWRLKFPTTAAAGVYAVTVCADVLAQVHEASKKHECRKAGTITFSPSGEVKGYGPTGEPPKTTPEPPPTTDTTPAPPPPPPGPPDTTINSGPSGAVATATATFAFTSTQSPSTFQCSVDGGAWAACLSPQTYTGLAEGTHLFQVRAVNSLSEVDATPAEAKWTVETEPPLVGLAAPLNEAFTNEATPLFDGAASNGANDSTTVTLKIYSGLTVGGPLVQTLETKESAGSWAITPTKSLTEGAYTAQASQADAADGVGVSNANTFTVKLTPPLVTLTEPPNASYTNKTKPTFAGAAGIAAGDLPAITVNVYSGATATGTPTQTLTTTASGGTWSATPTTALSPGEYTAQATQGDKAGNTGKTTPATFTIKTTPPPVTLTEPTNSSTTNKSKPQFGGAAGNEAGASTTVKVNVYSGAAATGTPVQTLTATAAGGTWHVTSTMPLASGEYTAQAVQDDAAGNEGKSSANTFTVNTTAPTVTMTTPKIGSETNNTTPTFAGAAGTATGDLSAITVNIYSGATATGTPVEILATTTMGDAWSVQATTPLFNGEYTAQASQENEAGNVGVSSTVTFTVNTTPPAVTLTEPANGAVVGQSKPTLTGVAETGHGAATTVTVKIYTAAATTGTPAQTLSVPVTAKGWTITPTTALSDGTYTAQATQGDEAGNEGKSSANTFTVETKAPSPVTGVGVADNTGSAIALSWTNPTGPDYQGVVVRRAVGITPPSSPTEGTLVGETSDKVHEITDKTVTAGTTYSYALFAHNALKQYATAVTITVKAQETTGNCTDTWTGATNKEWNEATNWSNGHVPSTSDWVCIPAKVANLPVNLNTPQIVDGLTNAGELSVNSSLELSNAKNKSSSTGVLTIAGSLEVAHELEVLTLNLNGTIDGAGVVTVPATGALNTQYGELGVTELVNNGTATVAAERSLNVRASAKFVNRGSLTLNAGASLTGGCGHEATVTEPAVPSGELVDPGKITTNGKTETGSSPVSIGPNGYCLVTHDTGALNVASGELKLGGSDFNLDTGSTIIGGAGAQLNFQGTVSLNAATSTITVPIVVTGTTAGKGNLVASSLKLAGTLDGTGTTTVPSGGELTLESGQVDAGELVNEGAATIPVNASLYVSAAAKLANKGALSLAANSSLYGGCGHEATATEPEVPDGEFVNSGAITSNATGGPAEIGVSGYCLVTNDTGSLNIASGELKLGGRAFNINTGASVTGGGSSSLILETTTNFNSANTSLPLTVIITGQAAGAGNVSAPKLKLTGTLNGSGTWTVPGTGTLSLESGQVDAGELLNEGTAVVPTNTQPYVGTNAKFVNKGALSLEAGSSIYGGCGHEATATEPAVSNGEFVNSGAITTNGTTKTGSSPVSIGYPYNYCLITHDSGSLKVASGELKLGGQSYNFDTGSSVTGGTGAKLTLEATVSFNAATTSLPLPVVVAGQTSGAGNVVASNSLKLNGTLNGTGNVTVSAAATMTLEGGQIGAGQLINEGTATVPSNAQPYVGQEAKLINKGSLSFAVGSSLYGGCGHEATATEPAVSNGEFVNSGAITTNGTSKTGGSPVTIGYPYNYCLVTHDTGSLDLASGELKLGGSGFNFDTGSTVTGVSTSELVLEATVNFNAASTTLPVPVVLTGQTSGAGNILANDSLKLSGALNGTGTTTVPFGATLTIEGGQVDAGELLNEGTASVIANAQPYVGQEAKLVNKGSLSFAVGSSLYGGCGHAATATEPEVRNGEFVSSGSLTTNGSSETGSSPVTIGYPYNYCLVTHDSGSLNVASGQLKLGGSDFNFDTGSTVTGAATSQLVLEGTVSFNASTTTLPAPVVVVGSISGGGAVVATDSLKLTGYLGSSGEVSVTPKGTLTIEGGDVGAGELVNEGTASVTPNAQLYVGQEAKFVNKGSLSFAVGSSIYGGCGHEATATEPAVANGEFVNTGSIATNGTSETGSSPVTIGYPYNYCLVTHDSGSLNVASGQLKLGGRDFNFDTGSTVTGAATSQLVLEGTVSFNAANTTLPVPVVVTGSVAGGGNVSASDSFKLTGSLGGSGTVAVSSGGTMVMEGGSISSGALVNEGAGSVTPNAEPYVGESAKLVNRGSLSFAVGSLLYGGCGREATATEPAIANGEFVSSGSITTNGKSETGSSPVTIGYPYNYCLVTHDSGSLNVASGELRIGGSDFYFDTGATVTGASSAVLAMEATVNSDLSSVGGIGTVEDNGHLHAMHSLSLPHFVLGGSLELSPGVLVNASSMNTINGGIELDGTGGFGRLNVGGSVVLNSISLSFTSLEYVPGCGAKISALTAGNIAGGFGSVSGGDSLAEGSWEPWSSVSAAGGYRYCPPPPAPAVQTYGSGTSYDSFNPSGYQAEPVNTATGAYNTTETDATTAGLGEPFTFSRSYTSSNTYSGPLGPGWTDSLNVFLTPESNGDVVLSSENGQQTTFVPQGEGVYKGGAGTRSTLTSQSGGGWLLVRQNQQRLTFNESGRMITETDRNGIGLTLSYSESGQLSSVKDHAGRVVTFAYNSAGLLASMSLPLARSVSYGYNSSNQLTSVTDAAGGVTAYEYTGEGLLASITNQDSSKVVTNTYAEGKVVKQVNALGGTATFSYENGTTIYTDPDGHAWKDIYSGDVLVERIDPTGGVTRYSYDANLDKTAVTDPNENTTTMSYDVAGNMLTRTSPRGETKTWTYDALNDVSSYTDADGNKTSYTYDAKGDRVGTKYADGATASETHDPTTGALTSTSDALGNTTHYGRDTEGNLTSVTSSMGEKTTYGYDAAGRKTSMVSARGNETGAEPSKYTTLFAYEPNNRLVSVTDPDGHVTKTAYDKVGNRISVTNPNGDTTKWGYDAQNELTSVTDPEDGATKYTYDAAGNRESATTPLGHITNYSYDADGRLKKMTNPLGHSTTYTYDSAGNRTSVTDAIGTKTMYVYNADDELAETSYSDGTPRVSYTYDAAGNRTQMTDGTGTTISSYDARNRVTAASGPQGSFSYSYGKDGEIKTRTYPDGSTVTATYDGDRRLASVTADAQTTTYSYDADSQLTKTTLPAGNGYTETTTYDPAGRIDSISDTNDKSTLTSFAYTYDAAGNPTKVVTNATTTTYGYDKDRRLTSACYRSSCAEGSIGYTYDADGDRKKLIDSAGTTSYSYNEGGQLTTTEGSGGKMGYTYDNDGRRTAAGPTTYAWNAANELTNLTSSGTTINYAYDGAGNRASATSGGQTTSFVYDTNNMTPRLGIEVSTASSSHRYMWADGLLLSMATGGSDYYIAHDAQGSVTALTSSTGATEDTYTYDPFGNSLTESAAKGAPAISLRYDGEYLDPTGLYHLGARQLDPTIGAFISTDPLMPTPTQPAISPYLYVNDQPTVLFDPNGESSQGGYANGLDQQINQYEAWYYRTNISDPLAIARAFTGSSSDQAAGYGATVFSSSDIPSGISGPSGYVSAGLDGYSAFNALSTAFSVSPDYTSPPTMGF